MKKLIIMLLLVITTLGLTACVDGTEVKTAVEQFCEDNPDALACQNPSATRDALVADMFNTILLEFVSGSNTDFCTDYFDDSALIDACTSDKWSLVPEDIEDLGEDLTINPLTATNEFEVLTEYQNGTPAYRFVVKVTEDEGLLKFNKFEYDLISSEATLTLSEMDIKMFMNTMLNAPDSGDPDPCDEFFTLDGKADCEAGQANYSRYLTSNPVVTHLSGNTYTYTVSSYDGYDQVTYTVTFASDGADGFLIDSIGYVHNPNYNTLSHAYEMMTDPFAYQFNRVNGGTYNACSYTYDDGTTACRDALNQFTGETMTIGTYQESSTPGIFEFELLFDSGSLDTLVEIVINEYHVYEIKISFGEPNSNTDEELTVLAIEEKLYDMYLEQSNNDITCSDYFTANAIQLCTTDDARLYHDLLVNDVNLTELAAGLFLIVPNNANGEFDGYTRLYPSYEAELVIENGKIKIDAIDFYVTPTATDFEQLTLEYMGYFMNPTYGNESICDMVNYWVDSNPFFADQTCETWRTGLLNDAANVSYEFLFGPNPYGTEIPILRIQHGQETQDFEVTLNYYNSTTLRLRGMWYILYQEDITSEQVDSALNSFSNDLTNSTITTTDFCATYDLGPDCVTIREEVLQASLVSVDIVVTTDDQGQDQYTLTIDVDGSTTDFSIDIDVTGDVPVIANITPTGPCECEPCDPCVCDYSILVHEISNRALWNEFLTLYNDSTITDQSLIDSYFGGATNELMTARTNLGNAQLLLVNATVNRVDGIFVDAVVVLSTTTDSSVVQYEVTFVASVLDNGYLIDVSSVTSSTSLGVPQATSLFEAYLTDYVDFNISNDTLEASYFTVDMKTWFVDRMSFIFNGGTLELVSVSLDDGVFEAVYQETLSGVTTTYVQTFFAHNDQTMTFFELQELAVVVIETTEAQALTILQDMFAALEDESTDYESFCSMYFGGTETCPFTDPLNPLGSTFDVSHVETEIVADQNVYTIQYSMTVMGETYDVEEQFQVQTKSDGTVLVQSLGKVSSQLEGVSDSDLDLLPIFEYVELFFAEYFDNTISSATFCDNHIFHDQYFQYLYETVLQDSTYDPTTYCEQYRDHNFTTNSDLEIVNIELINIGYHHDGTKMYGLFVISRGHYVPTHDNDVNTGQDFLYLSALSVIPNASVTNGYQMLQFHGLAELATWSIKQADIDAFVANEVQYLTNPANTSTDICNRYQINVPGHDCFLTISSVDGMTFVRSSYTIGARTANGSLSYDLLPLDITLRYVHPTTGFTKSIVIRINVKAQYNSSLYYYQLVTDMSTKPITYETPVEPLDYDLTLAQINSYIQAYFDSTITNAEFIAQYQNGDDMGGEFGDVRNLDLNNAINPTVIGFTDANIGSDYPEGTHILMVWLENNGIVSAAMLWYYEADGGTPAYFVAIPYVINTQFNGFTPTE